MDPIGNGGQSEIHVRKLFEWIEVRLPAGSWGWQYFTEYDKDALGSTDCSMRKGLLNE
jgi:hypothetical protein